MKLGTFISAIIVALTPAAALAQSATAYRTVSSATFDADRSGAVLVDVREPSEWAQTGLPKAAIGISVSRADFTEAVAASVSGDRTKPVAVICRSGSRSVKAAEMLSKAGFTNIINVGDGMIGRESVGKGWLAAGLATQDATVEAGR